MRDAVVGMGEDVFGKRSAAGCEIVTPPSDSVAVPAVPTSIRVVLRIPSSFAVVVPSLHCISPNWIARILSKTSVPLPVLFSVHVPTAP